jgi:hypothetical protein
MSSLKTVLISDSRLDISDDVTFGVQSNAAQSTYQAFTANSISTSSVSFNIQVPSENIVIDREVYIKSKVTTKLSLSMPNADCAAAPVQVLSYGASEAFQAYPLNSLFLTTQATINNTSTSENTQDIMAMLTQMYDKRDISRFNSMTPTLGDNTFASFQDSAGSSSNVLSGALNQGMDKNFSGRASHPISMVVSHDYLAAPIGNVPAVQTNDDSLTALAGSTNNVWTVYITGTFTEPFLALSPFLNVTPEHERSGLMGINNMSLVLNIDSSCKRLFSTAQSQIVDDKLMPKYINSISLALPNGQCGLQDTQLLMNFLSMTPEQMAKLSSPKNVVPYVTYPRYLSNSASGGSIPAGSSSTITSQSVQLSMIPDKILICARVPMSQQTIAHSNSFLAPENISVTFNNASGLLSTATQQDLFSKISYVNGSGQTWGEFSGLLGVHSADGKGAVQCGLGGVLILDPSADFGLPPYLSASSLGQFQFQFTMTVKNGYEYPVAPEIVIITVNSGVFSTVSGTSQIFTGMLTKDAVLSAKSSDAKVSSGEFERLVGGKQSVFKNRIRGAGMSGGGSSGGGMSGGKARPNLSRLY